jgi:hypothetical protein
MSAGAKRLKTAVTKRQSWTRKALGGSCAPTESVGDAARPAAGADGSGSSGDLGSGMSAGSIVGVERLDEVSPHNIWGWCCGGAEDGGRPWVDMRLWT